MRWVIKRPDRWVLGDEDLLGRKTWYAEDYEGWDQRMLDDEVGRLNLGEEEGIVV
jgi:hypothetical protein